MAQAMAVVQSFNEHFKKDKVATWWNIIIKLKIAEPKLHNSVRDIYLSG